MLSQTLVMVHVGLASSTGAPEFMIEKAEGDLLAKATVNVLDQFDIKPDPKTQAIFGLIIAAGTVYGPRAIAFRIRTADEAKSKNKGGELVDLATFGQN